ncbi:phenylacetate-CoA oxygenase subunit PaaJ [Rhodospirillaceae bacterium KN72]|uniref:Phenylacetate-CoA oxygenase subunit PaaJ n=1 Tax=Pacificispira spongiicola TaxID=2729598 RepID=A0A7Y0HCR3_9PROT|nr:1,2-phenylacetyl-CoA epoxidase subunit PaaD [Pacificispira spongiicola]NMM42875.1 phenylacetate-CoA oxygenase subunit PaaJ [Pacificispira spongiicola]
MPVVSLDQQRKFPTEAAIWRLLEEVPDPEVPVLTILDLGVVRSVAVAENGAIRIGVTPTYSGCPATAAINMAIRDRLLQAGHDTVTIDTILAPAWTTDWISEDGKRKLRDYGIAPPVGTAAGEGAGRGTLFGADPDVPCPHCGSAHTEKVSEFGSTACKAQYRCTDCLEPFEYFKCI